MSCEGRQNVVENLFTELSNNIRPYKIGEHKHIPEIQKILYNCNKKNVSFSFTPHVIPVNRGILSTIYVKLKKARNIKNIKNILIQKYSNNNFIKILKDSKHIPSINDVIGTNNCVINVFKDKVKNRAIIISVIDNLIKGASGQAIQNMNIKFGFNVTEGLKFNPIFP